MIVTSATSTCGSAAPAGAGAGLGCGTAGPDGNGGTVLAGGLAGAGLAGAGLAGAGLGVTWVFWTIAPDSSCFRGSTATQAGVDAASDVGIRLPSCASGRAFWLLEAGDGLDARSGLS